MTHPFRFGVQLAKLPPETWRDDLRRIESLGLVHREPDLVCMAPRQVCYVLVGCSQALPTVDHDNRHIGFLESAYGLLDHAFVDPDLTARDPAGRPDPGRRRRRRRRWRR